MKNREELIQHIEKVKDSYSRESKELSQIIYEIEKLKRKKELLQKALSKRQSYINQITKNLEEEDLLITVTVREYVHLLNK